MPSLVELLDLGLTRLLKRCVVVDLMQVVVDCAFFKTQSYRRTSDTSPLHPPIDKFLEVLVNGPRGVE